MEYEYNGEGLKLSDTYPIQNEELVNILHIINEEDDCFGIELKNDYIEIKGKFDKNKSKRKIAIGRFVSGKIIGMRETPFQNYLQTYRHKEYGTLISPDLVDIIRPHII